MHLIGLTVVETCRRYLPRTAASTVSLKWPNDIYATYRGQPEKIGGIIVNNIPTTLPGSRNRILIGERNPPFDFCVSNATTGCGLNIRKHGPACSLSRLATTDISMEEVLANVMALLSRYWDEFLLADGSFAGFEERYKSAWIHK